MTVLKAIIFYPMLFVRKPFMFISKFIGIILMFVSIVASILGNMPWTLKFFSLDWCLFYFYYGIFMMSFY